MDQHGISLGRLPVLDRLAACSRILLVGAGGGFDILSGLPLFLYLRSQGKEAFLASLSFSNLKQASGRRLTRDILEVRPDSGGDDDYFPERYLSEWLSSKGMTPSNRVSGWISRSEGRSRPCSLCGHSSIPSSRLLLLPK